MTVPRAVSLAPRRTGGVTGGGEGEADVGAGRTVRAHRADIRRRNARLPTPIWGRVGPVPVGRATYSLRVQDMTYEFDVVRVDPLHAAPTPASGRLPAVIYLQGAGSQRGLTGVNLERLGARLHRSIVVFAPRRPLGTWWTLRGDSWYAWVEAKFDPRLKEALSELCEFCTDLSEVESERGVTFVGFSAGAYAITEVISGRDGNVRPV